MYIVSETVVKKIATPALAFDAVKKAFIAAWREAGQVFPVVIAEGVDEGNIFSVKSGNLSEERLSGLKMGSYWARNLEKGLPNHSTTTVLLDEETGISRAVVNAGFLNGLRTAAADAVATSVLARSDAKVLGCLGAGHQAVFEIEALMEIRDFERVLIHSRNPKTVERAIGELAAVGIEAEATDAKAICEAADVLITATNATAPLLEIGWVRPGTHISAMGADQTGKQELPLDLVAGASLFADVPSQSRAIGEFEKAAAENSELEIVSIGAVLTGNHPGRTDEDEITIFDSSGIALQDLCAADAVLAVAISLGLAQEVDFT